MVPIFGFIFHYYLHPSWTLGNTGLTKNILIPKTVGSIPPNLIIINERQKSPNDKHLYLTAIIKVTQHSVSGSYKDSVN